MVDEDGTDASTWLAFALGDLEAARSKPGHRRRPRIVAFHAQQAAEKALQRLPDGWRIKTRHPDLVLLSRVATDSRYPEDMTPVTPLQAATAVRQAIAIVRVIREDFESRGVATATLEPR